MLTYIARRLILVVFVLIGATLITFVISRVMPADPVRMAAGLDADQKTVERIRRKFGLDRPIWVQYTNYMRDLATGDLGRSLRSQQPVTRELALYFPATMELTVITLVIYSTLGIFLGTVAGMSPRPGVDTGVRISSLVAYSLPPFWVGLMLQVIFYAHWDLLPAQGRIGGGTSAIQAPQNITGLYLLDSLITLNWAAFQSSLMHLALPVLTLVLSQIGLLVRLVRVAVLDVRGRPFIRAARAKGLSERVIAYRHVLKNAMLPIITMIGIQLGWLLSGTVVVETIFGWPGLGRYAVNSVLFLDYNPVLGVTLLGTLIFLFSNLVVDILYTLFDPRISYS